MTWFEDLTPYMYIDTEPTNPPTLNVGWLARGYEFAKGDLPQRFVSRLQKLCEHAPTQQTRGLHSCELCAGEIPFADDERHSSAEIRAVGADGTRYAAPTLIVHYVTAHGYAPPQVFVDAVLRMDPLAWEHANAQQLCMSCGTKLVLNRRGGPVDFPWFSCEGCATTYWR